MPRKWISAHLFYTGNQDRLIVEALAPILRESSMKVTPDFFFVRHHLGGLHVRFRIGTVDEEHQRQARELIYVHASRFFRNYRPQKTSKKFSEATFLYLAKREGSRPSSMRYPDCSVQFIPYEFDQTRFGAENAEAVEQHFVESSRLARALLSAGASVEQRQAVAISAVVLAQRSAAGWLPGLVNRANWRQWSLFDVLGKHIEASYEQVFLAQQETLVRMVKPLMGDSATIKDRLAVPERAWLETVNRLLITLRKSPRRCDEILDTCTHLFCNRLGLPLSREGLVRYLAARSVQYLADERA